jgi:hypothetical protein
MEVGGWPHAPSALPQSKNPSTHFIGNCVGTKPVCKNTKNRKYLAFRGVQTRNHPARSVAAEVLTMPVTKQN